MLSFQFLRYLSLQIAHAAELAGLTGIYDTYYRGLSNDTPHPSVVALNHHMDADENGLIRGLRWGSDVLDVENTIMAVCTTTMHTIYLAKEMLNQEDISTGLDRGWEEYKRLTGVMAEATA